MCSSVEAIDNERNGVDVFGRTSEAKAEANQLRADLDSAHDRLRRRDDLSGPYEVKVIPDPQEQHQAAILADFQTATKANTEAKACLLHAEQVAAQASVALVEARRAMRRVTDGVV